MCIVINSPQQSACVFCYLLFIFLCPNEITNVGSVLNPSLRCSSNVMLGKSFEDFLDRSLPLNCRSRLAWTCLSVFPEGNIVSFGNVIFHSFCYLVFSSGRSLYEKTALYIRRFLFFHYGTSSV